ncbi:hypothetical protein [Alkalimonas sp.]|uniref:hypothetical protein n=1 Tax=Alkalimonas sp. TaxID=1872453 RepID=UPI00263B8F9F|nr:hypothetical protein [Alkalimonas sp.]MCC5825256.1 hypothetical protein [Alkalimonas sp.]
MKLLQGALLLAVSLGSLSMTSAFASERACLLEGDFKMLDQRIVINDCIENGSISTAQFQEMCQSMSNPLNDDQYQADITYMTACPANPQAKCKDVGGGVVSFYYYNRDAQLLESSQNGCQLMMGTWEQ